jgi:putative heme-binding domain-containing protein
MKPVRCPTAAAIFFAALMTLAAAARGDEPAGRQPPPKKEFDVAPVVTLFELVLESDAATARSCLAILAAKVQSGEVTREQAAALRRRLAASLDPIVAGPADGPLHADAVLLAASWNDPKAIVAARGMFGDGKRTAESRLAALAALIAAGDQGVLETASHSVLRRQDQPAEFRAAVLAALGRLDSPQVAEVVLAAWPQLEPELKPRAIEILTQRPAWSKALLAAIGRETVHPSALHANQVAKILATGDPELAEAVARHWGTVRTERNPDREQILAQMRDLLRETPGEALRGREVFRKVCGQCHKMHGQGEEVGPDITANGRASFEQLLSNVFDPSLVIGVAYQARTVVADDGRVITGLVAEESDQRVVLKVQGGKSEIIPRDRIESMKTSQLSLMPEGLEKQLLPQELADLFAYITLDLPPEDPQARRIPGAPSGP